MDIYTKEPYKASIERSDITAVPRAAIIGETVIATELAQAILEKFPHDDYNELVKAVNNYREYAKTLTFGKMKESKTSMKELMIDANALEGTITIPGDKSISHRDVMFASIAKGTTKIEGFLHAEDCISTMNIFRDLGVQIDEEADESVIVHGKGIEGLTAPDHALDAGNSGTTMRLLAGLFQDSHLKLK